VPLVELLSRGVRARGELEFEKLVDVELPALYWRRKRSFFVSYSARSSTPRSTRNCAHS